MTTSQTDKLILVVEDETDLAELICYNLEREGYQCRCAADGEAALVELRRCRPDLIVLDRMLPGKSGDAVASEVKRTASTSAIPILMLTAKVDETAQLSGFALGADDYVTKPFSIKVLLARIAAILRRSTATEDGTEILQAGPITLDPSRHEVTVDGSPTPLTSTEFAMLRTLMVANGRVMDRDQLISTVLGETVAVTDRTIDVHIAALRKKLAAGASWIQTIRGVGYTFRPPVS